MLSSGASAEIGTTRPRGAVEPVRDDQAHGDGFVAHHRFERIDRDHVVDRQRVGDDIDRAAAREAGRMGVGVAEAEPGGLA